jgi:hypothetical protein
MILQFDCDQYNFTAVTLVLLLISEFPWRLVFWVVMPCLLVRGSSEMLVVTYKTIGHHNPEHCDPHFHCHENHKSLLFFDFLK